MIFKQLERFIFSILLTLTCLSVTASESFYTEPLIQPPFIRTCMETLNPELYNEYIVIQNDDYTWEAFLNCPGDVKQSIEALLNKEAIAYEKLGQRENDMLQDEQPFLLKSDLSEISKPSTHSCIFVMTETSTRIHNYYNNDLDTSCVYIKLHLNNEFCKDHLNTFQNSYPELLNFGFECTVTEYHAYLCRRGIFKYIIIDDIPTAIQKITETLLDYGWQPLTSVSYDEVTDAACAIFERRNETALLMCLNMENERYLCLYIQEKFKL